MNIQDINISAVKSNTTNDKNRKVNMEFNAILWNLMLQQACKPAYQIEPSHGESVYKSLLLEEYSKHISARHPIFKV